MTKTGVKTFICSFVLSLFIIFSINGAFFCVPHKSEDNIKIPHKNITLFLKKENLTVKSVKTQEIKKIALSVPEQKIAEEKADIVVVENNVVQPKDIPQKKENVIAQIDIPLQKREFAESENEDILQLLPRPKEILKDDEIRTVAMSENFSEQQDAKEEKLAKNITSPLIPLEKGNFATSDMKKDVQIASVSNSDVHVALNDAQAPIASMKTEKSADDAAKWVTMKEKKEQSGEIETPWVMAKASNHPVNQLLKEEKFFKDAKAESEDVKKVVNVADPIKSRIHLTNDYQLQLASKTIDNILIPIPQDILDDENLTPKLVSSDNERSKEKEAELEQKYKEEQSASSESGEDEPKKSDSSIFDSLNSIFSSTDSNVRAPEPKDDSILSKIKKQKNKYSKNKPQRILPVEMRLSFQPGRAEISGQTLRWIKAFANKAKQDETTALEVRISGTNYQELQQKRLSLLNSILAHDGVAQGKVNMVFTDREPNSFIIRTIKVNNKQKTGVTGGNKRINSPGYYQQW